MKERKKERKTDRKKDRQKERQTERKKEREKRKKEKKKKKKKERQKDTINLCTITGTFIIIKNRTFISDIQGEGQGNSDIPAIPNPVPKDPVPVAEIPVPSSVPAAKPVDQSGSAMSQRSALPQTDSFLLQNLRPEAVGERGGGQGDGARKAPPPPPPPAKKGPGDLQHVTMVTRDKVKWKVRGSWWWW